MTENAEAERQLTQTVTAALSVALNVAMQVQSGRSYNAREVAHRSEEEQHELAQRLAAERETAAVLWRRIDDPEWVRTRPEEVVQAWASARAWETVDPRAAVAREKFDSLLAAMYGADAPAVRAAREMEDYRALAGLLQRATEITPKHAEEPRTYEMVPENERQAWLERQVWGPDSDPQTRVAASAQLADLHHGLPVTVLREMSADTRQAWIELGELDRDEQSAWRQAWLQREIWGPNSQDADRGDRAARLERELAGQRVEWDPAEWQAWVAGVRERNARQHATAVDNNLTREGPQSPIPRGEQASTNREHETATSPGYASAPTPAAARAETAQERLDRTAATVHAEWPKDIAAKVVSERGAFGAFAHRLHQLEQRGYEMTDVLHMIPAERLVGIDAYGKPVHSSAGFAEYFAKQLATSLPERADTEAGIARLEQFLATQSTQSGHQRTPQSEPAHTRPASAQIAAEENQRQDMAAAADRETAWGREDRENATQLRSDTTHDSTGTPYKTDRDTDMSGHAEQLDNAAAKHDDAAELARGAYTGGAEPARLAGEGFPRDITNSLSAGPVGKRQGQQSPQARKRILNQERTR